MKNPFEHSGLRALLGPKGPSGLSGPYGPVWALRAIMGFIYTIYMHIYAYTTMDPYDHVGPM